MLKLYTNNTLVHSFNGGTRLNPAERERERERERSCERVHLTSVNQEMLSVKDWEYILKIMKTKEI